MKTPLMVALCFVTLEPIGQERMKYLYNKSFSVLSTLERSSEALDSFLLFKTLSLR